MLKSYYKFISWYIKPFIEWYLLRNRYRTRRRLPVRGELSGLYTTSWVLSTVVILLLVITFPVLICSQLTGISPLPLLIGGSFIIIFLQIHAFQILSSKKTIERMEQEANKFTHQDIKRVKTRLFFTCMLYYVYPLLVISITLVLLSRLL